uniref:Replication factor C subunit 2 n=1 Tax=Strigamia maritima TaxID=126957 RepID=T1IN72_STRMM
MQAYLKGGKLSRDASQASSSKTKISPANKKELIPWVEKYRPKTVDEVAYQDEVVAVLKKSLKGADLPNLLFYGPPGTGKTSTILAAARELFGDMYRTRVLELNASDERGIQVIRDKVKTFAQVTVNSSHSDGKPCPAFKIIILDEADSMTSAAQAALRRTMEKHTKTTRFCLSCNYVSKIIEPLTSRCSKFRFKPLMSSILVKRLTEICEKENVKCDEKAMNSIVETSEGDLRKAITYLQSAHRLKGDAGITVNDIYEISGVIPNQWIRELLEVCRTNSYEKLDKFIKSLMAEGYCAYQLILQVHLHIVKESSYTDKQKSIMSEKLAICDHKLLDGADEYLQSMDLATTIMRQICHHN